MDKDSSRQKVMGNVRKALMANSPLQRAEDLEFSEEFYHEYTDSRDVIFAQEFKKLGGKFVYCESVIDFQKKLKGLFDDNKWKYIFTVDKNIQKLLKEVKIPFRQTDNMIEQAEVGLSRCEYLIARFGSVMVSSKGGSGRRLHAFPDTHIVVAYSSQVVDEIKDAMVHMKQRYSNGLPSSVTVISGPSRTADIEKTLVMGAHGPRDLILFFIDL